MFHPQATAIRDHWKHYLFYPTALAATLVFIVAEVQGWLGPLGRAYPLFLAAMIGAMVVLERVAPMRPQWGMTRASFLHRDLPMLVVNGVTIAATTAVVTWLAGQHSLPLYHAALPWWAEAVCALLLSDLLWYGVHRYAHEGRGALGRWLWKTHATHHMPAEVYVFMHAVGHPINSAYVRVLLMLPALLFGFSPQGVFAASVFGGFQGLVSHFNVDARAGWFNRLFMGTELHRLHHSADTSEALNYAATFSVWDQLFGTYRLPKQAPAALGMAGQPSYPQRQDFLQTIRFIRL